MGILLTIKDQRMTIWPIVSGIEMIQKIFTPKMLGNIKGFVELSII